MIPSYDRWLEGPATADNPPCACGHDYDDHTWTIQPDADAGYCTVPGCACVEFCEYDREAAVEDAAIARAEEKAGR